MAVDLNDEVTLHDGTRLTVNELLHQYDLMKQFIMDLAKGPKGNFISGTGPSAVGGYESKWDYYHKARAKSQQLAEQLWPKAQEQGS